MTRAGAHPFVALAALLALLGSVPALAASRGDRSAPASSCRGVTAAVARDGDDADVRRIRGAVRCLVTAERESRGRRALTERETLRKAAERHARDMVGRRYFSHVSPGGSRLLDRVRRAGYLRKARRYDVGEALGWGADVDSSPRALVEALLDSPEHRALLLDRSFRDIGIGVAFGVPDDEHRERPGVTITLNFGVVSRR